MKNASITEFLGDLFRVLVSTLDGVVTSLVMLIFLIHGVYGYLHQDRGEALVEGGMFALVALLMLIRLRHDTPASQRVHWGALVSVVAFVLIILLGGVICRPCNIAVTRMNIDVAG